MGEGRVVGVRCAVGGGSRVGPAPGARVGSAAGEGASVGFARSTAIGTGVGRSVGRGCGTWKVVVGRVEGTSNVTGVAMVVGVGPRRASVPSVTRWVVEPRRPLAMAGVPEVGKAVGAGGGVGVSTSTAQVPSVTMDMGVSAAATTPLLREDSCRGADMRRASLRAQLKQPKNDGGAHW